MGVAGSKEDSARLHTDIDVTFKMSGETDGAFDWALTETAVGGATRDDHTGHAGYNGNGGLDGTHDGQILRYDNTLGPIGVAVSLEIDDEIDGKGGDGGLVIGVGYQRGEDAGGALSVVGGSVSVSTGVGVQAILNFSNHEDDNGAAADTSTSHLDLGLGYTMGPATLGFAANYDLGGGATLQLGLGGSEDDAKGDDSTWSLGLAFSF